MHYQIKLGVPDFEKFFNSLVQRAQQNKLSKDEIRLFKQIVKAMNYLSVDPRHNSLNSHEIDDLTRRYTKMIGSNIKVWQSYLENNTPGAGRIYWVYGPDKGDITIVGLEPHPEDKKKDGYAKVNLSNMS
jgi:hypothetical protein